MVLSELALATKSESSSYAQDIEFIAESCAYHYLVIWKSSYLWFL